jgi:hypothetical protein
MHGMKDLEKLLHLSGRKFFDNKSQSSRWRIPTIAMAEINHRDDSFQPSR